MQQGVARALTMQPLPVIDAMGAVSRPVGTAFEWDDAVANLQHACAATKLLSSLVQDAVYLDDEAYSTSSYMSVYQHRAQAAERRALQLEHEALALRAELEAKDSALAGAAARTREAQAQVRELQQELENNAREAGSMQASNMHYQELLAKNQEIARLQAQLEVMQSAGAVHSIPPQGSSLSAPAAQAVAEGSESVYACQ